MDARRQTIKKVLFLDACVLFAATNSPTGGSSKIFSLTNHFDIKTSKTAAAEAEINIKRKLYSIHLTRFYKLIDSITIEKVNITSSELVKCRKVIVEKDAIILAEAKKLNAFYLITLDKKHFKIPKVEKFFEPRKIVSPKEFFSENYYA